MILIRIDLNFVPDWFSTANVRPYCSCINNSLDKNVIKNVIQKK